METKKINKSYFTRSMECKLKKGDEVIVKKISLSHQDGWENSWEVPMGKAVGNRYIVVDISHRHGITLNFMNNRYAFPFFVLEKVPDSQIEEETKIVNELLSILK